MAILDVDTVYTNTGDILQIGYAQKAADNGNTAICMKNKKGLIMIAEKPIESKLYVSEKNFRIKKVNNSIFQISSGIETDLVYINENLKNNLISEKHSNDMDVSHESVRNQIVNIIHQFTRYSGVRPIGINLLTCSKYKNEYKILQTDCTGKSLFFKSSVIGKGSRIVKTELEKLNLENMEIRDLVENGIRILYKSYDPLKDKPFDIEIGIMCEETNGEFVRLEKNQYSEIIEKYKDFSVDGEE
ncbi:proteasome subunit PSA7 (PSA7) [Vairimorpha necatrix]|uniref:Proteasome subunit PSA7 (PSA7) n=1 Tax=Vairimorpha necatrix TaxID=6039 RepID=A0AAX4JA95_9MICR|nr:Chain F, Proteasome subunit alpha type-7 [Vairimorpha necatrix]8ADN_T Chain T, Proteasome subunit alpha type-7 [Vairimorpha necatrix]